MREILELCATYGLPIVLTVWFVFRIDVMITKLVNLLEAFIKWLMEKELERKDKDKEIRDELKAVHELGVESINRIKILEVRSEK